MTEEHILYSNFYCALFFISSYVLLLPVVDEFKLCTQTIKKTQKHFYQKEKKPPDGGKCETK